MAWTPLGSKSFGNQPTKVTSYSDKDLIAIINDKIDNELAKNRKVKLLEVRITELEAENNKLRSEIEIIKKHLKI